MGAIIDLERKDNIYRCNYVKFGIILINLIGPPLSLLFLIISIIRMVLIKKKKAFLTYLIILIFISEIIQCLSKLIQLLKYDYPDTRTTKDTIELDNPRGIICQIQITMAIFSDLCSLLSTLLLSFRCYDVIHHKKRIFDQEKKGVISILILLFISFSVPIIFLVIDREITKGNVSYKYDLRDRCSYWCWLAHIPSICCLGFYYIILLLNIYFACKTICYLKNGYKKLIEENKLIPEEGQKDNISHNSKKNNMLILTPEDKKRILQLQLLKTKCLIYPTVTIAYWVFAATYRIVDDTVMKQFDDPDKDPYESENEERELFQNHKFFQFIVQFFFVIYTFLSSIRGILYGVSFMVFEEKIFFNFFKKFWLKYLKDDELEIDKNDEMEIMKYSNSSEYSYRNSNSKEDEKDETNYSNMDMNRKSNSYSNY